MVHRIHLFISHSWKYSNHYDKLEEWIFNTNWKVPSGDIEFRNYSVPKNDPIHDAPNQNALNNAILQQISSSHVVLIPTGMYVNYSKWIQKEIDGAKRYNKPILAIDPWGQQKSSSIVMQAATDFSGWNRDPIVAKIWNLYHERK